MNSLSLVALIFASTPSLATNKAPPTPTLRICESHLARFKPQVASRDAVLRALDQHTEARRLWSASETDRDVIVLVSRDEEIRRRVALEIMDVFDLPAFVPGSDQYRLNNDTATGAEIASRELPASARLEPTVPRDQIDSVTLVDRIALIEPSFWSPAENEYLVHRSPYGEVKWARRSSSMTMALVGTEVDYGVWADHPRPTLRAGVERESIFFAFPEEIESRIAAIYYVGRPQELLDLIE